MRKLIVFSALLVFVARRPQRVTSFAPSTSFIHPPSLPSTWPRPRINIAKTTTREHPSETESETTHSFWKDLPLARRHEHVIFAVYASFGTLLLMAGRLRLLPIVLVESAFCLIWSGMIWAISFLEAWVKFKAPFLRKHVAVDMGRHVFCAFNTAEWAWSTCFGFLLISARQPRLRPLLAIFCLWVEIFVVAPKLYTRAQHQIMTAFQDADGRSTLDDSERESLMALSQHVQNKPKQPDAKWHVVYVGLEVVKLTSLMTFVWQCWTKFAI